MTDKDLCVIKTEHFTIEGRSRAGQETYFRVRELGIALDIGRGPDLIIGVPNVFVTHAHLDHAHGIPYYAGQRKMQDMAPGRVFVPAESADDFRALMAIHERLEGVEYDIEIVGVAAGETIRLSRTLEVRAHRATHRVAARAYEFVDVRHRLKHEYAALGGEAIAELRSRGVEVAEPYRQSILCYTGDTDRGILAENEAIFKSEVLMIECSFVAEGHQSRAAMYRHIHFDDLSEFAERFENRLIVLTHFSRRYSRQQIQELVRKRCPEVLRERIRLALPEGYQRV